MFRFYVTVEFIVFFETSARDMEIWNVYLTVLLCLSSYPHFSNGSTPSVTKALNVADYLTSDHTTAGLTTLIKKQVSTGSVRMKSFSISDASHSPRTVHMSTVTSPVAVSSASQRTSTTEKSLPSIKAQLQPTSVTHTLTPTATKSVQSSTVLAHRGDGSPIPRVLTKLKTSRPLEFLTTQTKKTSTSHVAVSSASQRTLTTEKSLPSTKAQLQPTSVTHTLTVTKSVQSSTVLAHRGDGSLIPRMTTKLKTSRPSEFSTTLMKQTSLKSSSAASVLLLTTGTASPKTTNMTKEGDDDGHGSTIMIITVVAVSLTVILGILTVIFVVLVWKNKTSNGFRVNASTTGDSSDSPSWHFSRTAIDLNQYESTFSMVRNSMHPTDDNTLAFPSSFLPLKEASESPSYYEEVRNVQEDKDGDNCTFPSIRCKDTEGYVAMPSNVGDEDEYGYAVPMTTLHKAIRTTSIQDIDDNDYLVPRARCCRAETGTEMIGSSTEAGRYTNEEEGDYMVPTAIPRKPTDNIYENVKIKRNIYENVKRKSNVMYPMTLKKKNNNNTPFLA